MVLILLRGAQGTRYAYVPQLMTREMLRLAAGYVVDRQGRETLTPLLCFTFDGTFARTIDAFGDILASHRDGPLIGAAFELFWRFQLAGLQALLNPPAGSGS